MALYYQSPTRNLPDGYTFRGATLSDIPVVAYLMNQRQITLPGGAAPSIAEMRQEWQTPHFTPALDVRLVFDQREHLAGYIEVWTDAGLGSHPWLWGCVHPNFEGRGIGTALLRWAEARVRLAMELLPPYLRVAPRFGARQAYKTAPALARTLGWQPVCADEAILPQVMHLTSTLLLVAGAAYDIYEKEIRPGDDLIPVVI